MSRIAHGLTAHSCHPPLEGEGRERSERGGVILRGCVTPSRPAFGRSTSPLQGEVVRAVGGAA